jgi:membrane-associated phospholipid phosphatase
MQLQSRAGKRWLFVALSIVFFAAAVFTAFYDMSVSTRFVNAEAGWAVFFEAYGKLPGLLVGLVGAVALGANLRHESRSYRPLLGLLLFVIGSLVSVFAIQILGGSKVNVGELRQSGTLALAIGAPVLLAILAWFLSRSETIANVRVHRFGRVTTFTLLIGNLILIQGLKQLWGRVRFRDLTEVTDFTAWYLPQGMTGDASFPSGHTGMGWLLLPLILLIPEENRAGRVSAGVLVSAFAIAVALSRVKIGAHYLSDVLFASAIEIGVFAFAVYFFPEKSARSGE